MPNMVPFGGTFNGEPDFAHGADERVLIDRLLRSTCIMAHALKEGIGKRLEMRCKR